MRRLGVRLSMLGVGVVVAAVYLGAAALLVQVFVAARNASVDLATTAVALCVTTAVVGYLSYRFGTARTLSSLDAAEVDWSRAPGLSRRLDALCERMDVERPRVLVGTLGAPNAFSLGGARGGTVVVDRSLFSLLTPEEFEAIFAHELAHLAGYDGLLKTLAYSAVQTLTGVVFVVTLPLALALVGLARGLAWARGRPLEWRANPLARVRRWLFDGVGVLLFLLVVALFAHSRRREFAADDRAAHATGRPLALARALRKLEVAEDRWLLSSLTVRGAEDDGRLGRLLATHPSTDERVARLVHRAERERETRHHPSRNVYDSS